MKKIKVKQIKSRECEILIQSHKGLLRNDLREDGMEGLCDIYLLDTGELLVRVAFEKRNGVLYKSYDDYQTILERIQNTEALRAKYPIEKGASLNNYLRISVADFKSILSNVSEKLEHKFDMKPKSLDYSLSSLATLSKKNQLCLKKIDISDFEEQYLILITAYIGEVMCRQIDGEWQIVGNEEGIVHQVLIVERQNKNRVYHPQSPLDKILSGDAGHNRLNIEVNAELYRYGFSSNNGSL